MAERAGKGLMVRGSRLVWAVLAGLLLCLCSLPSAHVSHAEKLAIPIPTDIGRDEHWVDVNLSQQILVAMDGGAAVKVIFVTTGMPGFETPAGTFHILNRVEDETMRSSSIGIPIDSPDGYDLEHVMYTQYFTGEGHALHDNYWRPNSVFGSRATSHGCAGMRLDDAKFLWDYLNMGARVVIHY